MSASLTSKDESRPFQLRVVDWMMETFSMEVCRDKTERNHRFLEESLELVQAMGGTAAEAHMLVDYVFGRPVGEPEQEVGGVMVTLAALCAAADFSMATCADTELARCWKNIERIRAKQAGKPKHSPPRPSVETRAEWCCFHCEEVFTDREKAAEHFGKYEMLQPACTIDIAEYRRMEEVNSRHCAEDTDLHREIYSMSANHAVALRREEEKGYARGLQDAGFTEKARCGDGCPGCDICRAPTDAPSEHPKTGAGLTAGGPLTPDEIAYGSKDRTHPRCPGELSA